MAKVLIVDDSSLARKFLKRILLKANHEVIAEAENGEKGILEFKRVKPEIVTMDLDMPGINGIEASKRILKDYPEARIIIISAHEKNDLMDEMDKYGLKHYIIKPVTDENVREAFQRALWDVSDEVAIKAPDNVKADNISEAKVSETKAPKAKVPEPKVSVCHHSVMNIFAAIKTGEEGKILSLQIEKGIPLNDFMEEDPIVLGYESNGLYILSQCVISNIDTANKSLKVEIINSNPFEAETTYQNLPASIYVDIREISTRKRHPAVIKIFKVNEILFKSKVDFVNNAKVSFDIFYKNKLLPIDGKIISKSPGKKNTEYIIKLEFDDYNTKKIYLTYLQELASDMENSIQSI
ncbi:MAG: response regulator [Ruminiclostridium sp.]|nr:response regulator [Ruminiclostridium sp.]